MSEVAEKLEQPKEAPAIYEYQMRLTESVVLDYFITVDPEVTRADLLRSDFWMHVANSFKPFTKLRVAAEDGSFYAELMVLSAGRNWAAVHELGYYDLHAGAKAAEKALNEPKDFEVQWKGPINKYCIVRLSDKEIIQKNIEQKEAAYLKLSEYLKVINK